MPDPTRRAGDDRSSQSWLPPRGRSTPTDGAARSAPSVMLRSVLVAGALLTFLVYRPQVGVVLVALSGFAWAIWRYPRHTRRLLLSALALVLLAVLGVGVSTWLNDRRAAQELRGLDLPTLLSDELREQTSVCLKSAPMPPEVARAYCACLADATRARFDQSPVNVDSAADYRQVMRVRLRAAAPGPDSEANCLARGAK